MGVKITRFLVWGLAISTIVTFVAYLVVHLNTPQITPKATSNFLQIPSPDAAKEDISALEDASGMSATKEPVVDEATFKEIISPIFPNNHEYFRDKNFVYRNVYGELRIFVGAEPKGFELVGACARGDGGSVHYTKDSVHVFCNEKIIFDADPGTFTVLGEIESTSTEDMPYVTGVAKDKNHVYFGSVLMNGINQNMCTKEALDKCLAE